MRPKLKALMQVPCKKEPKDRKAFFINRTLAFEEVEDKRDYKCPYTELCASDAIRVLAQNIPVRRRLNKALENAESYMCGADCPHKNKGALPRQLAHRLSEELVA